MKSDEIKVVVVAYPDRKNLMMRYTDPVTGKQAARSTGTTNRRDADRAAAKWEAELQEGRYRPASRITWEEFRERYEDEKLSALSKNTLPALACVHRRQIVLKSWMTADFRNSRGQIFQQIHQRFDRNGLRQRRAFRGLAIENRASPFPEVVRVELSSHGKGG